MYPFDTNSFKSGTGHFTQVVWKGSTTLGLGVAKGERQNMICYYAVARYRPPGNYDSKFLKNVVKGTLLVLFLYWFY